MQFPLYSETMIYFNVCSPNKLDIHLNCTLNISKILLNEPLRCIMSHNPPDHVTFAMSSIGLYCLQQCFPNFTSNTSRKHEYSFGSLWSENKDACSWRQSTVGMATLGPNNHSEDREDSFLGTIKFCLLHSNVL